MDNQKLLDILIQCTMMVHTHKWFDNKTCDEVGEYIREQLRECGIKTIQSGSSHVVLVDG